VRLYDRPVGWGCPQQHRWQFWQWGDSSPLVPQGAYQSGVIQQVRQTVTSVNLLVTGTRQNVASHWLLSVFYSAAAITLLVEETICYHQQYLDFLDDGPSLVPEVTESEVFLFPAVIA
jgi:hypothetical protein